MITRTPMMAAPMSAIRLACPTPAASTAIARAFRLGLWLRRAHRGLVLARHPAVALNHRISRQRKQDHQELDRQRLEARVQADRTEKRAALDLGNRDHRLFLEFLHRLADEF